MQYLSFEGTLTHNPNVIHISICFKKSLCCDRQMIFMNTSEYISIIFTGSTIIACCGSLGSFSKWFWHTKTAAVALLLWVDNNFAVLSLPKTEP